MSQDVVVKCATRNYEVCMLYLLELVQKLFDQTYIKLNANRIKFSIIFGRNNVTYPHQFKTKSNNF